MYPPLCNISAVKFWTAYGAPGMSTAHPITTPTHFDPPDAHLLSAAEGISALRPNGPIHILCPDAQSRRRAKGMTCHACEIIPREQSVLRCKDELTVISPELSFVEMGKWYPLERLAQYGTMLCSKYGIRTVPTIDHSAPEQHHHETELVKRSPVTSAALIRLFLEKYSHLHGRTNAKRALSYVFDRSRSPMETATVLLLSLPSRYGGFNLARPMLNAPVKVNRAVPVRNRNGSIAMLNEFECDLVWRTKNGIVVVEYQGELAHSGESNIHRDSRKHNALEDSGTILRSLTKETLLDFELFSLFAYDLTKLIRHHERTILKDIKQRRQSLHQSLLRRYLTARRI